ncbi:ATP-dependent 6-phosphofructokinase [Thalassotalea ponticola]|uniref:6-phosphofructokinase n=1 Tax=Thalassotalea ponticola TaxID=1523392 RepID=UPI0025B5FC21|nr:ATP-dependent 6-phosphofructokinase [Thalassotalea ponticola]MDN3651536.1 ATP-dependent 6-phosphofructokinase [Thalassotalea ponticola]
MSENTPFVLGILTSGGDAPGMNAAIRSCTLSALQSGFRVIGFTHGFYGLLDKTYIDLDESTVRDIIHCGGTILKSARCPEFKTAENQQRAANNLHDLNVNALIVIGGDGSFNGMLKLSHYYTGQLIGLPGTIDNDIDGTDHTIGFATAVETAIQAVDKIRDTADAFERIFIIEVMGRHSGFLALNVGIASAAEQIITFENFENPGKELQKIAEHIALCKKQRGLSSYLIVAAENLWPGGVSQLAEDLANYANIRCTPCILGYIQRGGAPLAKDRILATKLGIGAVEAVIDNKTLIMIGESNRQTCQIPLTQAVAHQKTVNKALLAAQESVLDIAKLAKSHLM